jgi:hypothetical protein
VIRGGPFTSARAACTGGAEKFGSPVGKTIFDSIDPERKSDHWAISPLGREFVPIRPGLQANRVTLTKFCRCK